MTLRRTFSLFFALCVVASTVIPVFARADSTPSLTVVPVVVDEKAKARDILKESITLTNPTQRKLTIYTAVNDVKPEVGQEAFVSSQGGDDEKTSLANWIEISRGVVDLNPGETKEIPFVIRVSLNAMPGTYHADISFYEGSTLAEAQARSPLGVITVNTEVQAVIKESMQLNKFVTDSFFFSGDDVLFNYQLQNIGNQELKPKGEIRIYDRKGREVAAIPVNPDGKAFTPDQEAQLASAWSAAQGFGKFKAFLNIDYGNGSGSLQDTVFFWIIPWQQLLAIAVISIIAIIVSALYFHRWLEHRHMQRFALAGMGAGVGAAAMAAPAGMLVQPKSPPRIATVMPVAPVAEKPVKKGFFSRFKRAKKTESEPVASSVAAAPVPVADHFSAPTPVPVPVPVQEMSRPAVVAESSRGTIDLSATQMNSPVKKSAGHVINLKNGV